MTPTRILSRAAARAPLAVPVELAAQVHERRAAGRNGQPVPRAFFDLGIPEASAPEPFKMPADGIAVVPIKGELQAEQNWMGSSYEEIATALRAAEADERVKSIVLDVNSVGGEVVGMAECAAIVADTAKRKPVVAVVGAHATSAAYCLIAGASKIIASKLSALGSIGVVMEHCDNSEANAQAGKKYTYFFEGAFKTAGNENEPLSQAAMTEFAKIVSTAHTVLVESISTNRPNLTPQLIVGLQAATLYGPEAVQAGLADEIGTMDEVLPRMTAAMARMAAAGAAKPAIAAKGPNGRAKAATPRAGVIEDLKTWYHGDGHITDPARNDDNAYREQRREEREWHDGISNSYDRLSDNREQYERESLETFGPQTIPGSTIYDGMDAFEYPGDDQFQRHHSAPHPEINQRPDLNPNETDNADRWLGTRDGEKRADNTSGGDRIYGRDSRGRFALDEIEEVEAARAVDLSRHTGVQQDGVVEEAEQPKRSEKERIKAILSHAEAEGRRKMAEFLAWDTDNSVQACIALLQAAPRGDAGFERVMASDGMHARITDDPRPQDAQAQRIDSIRATVARVKNRRRGAR